MAAQPIEVEIRMVGAEDASRRLGQISQAQQRLNAQFQAGRISAEKYDRSTQRLQASQRLLQGGVNTSSIAIRMGAREINRFSAAQQDAKNKAVLLGQQLGVPLPTAMQNLLVRTQALTRAINAAFAVGAVAFLVSTIGRQLIPVLESLRERMLGIEEIVKRIKTATEAATSGIEGLLKAPGETIDNQIRNLNNLINIFKQRAEDIIAGGEPFEDFDVKAGQLVRLREAVKRSEEIRDRLKEIQIQRDPIAALRRELGDVAPELIPVVGNIRQTAQAAKEAADAMGKGGAAVLDLEAGFTKLLPIAAEARKELKRLRDLKLEESIRQLDEELGFGTIPTFEEMQEHLRITAKLFGELPARARPPLQDLSEAFKQMSATIEGFLQNVFITARSFGDVWRQFVQQMVRVFLSGIARMVAAWLLGMRQIRAATAGGGILGGILGPLFGLGGIPGIGPGGTAPTFPGTAAAAVPSAGLGVAAAVPGVVTAAGLPGGGGGGATATALLGGGGGLLSVLGLGGVLGGLVGFGAAGRGSVLGGALGGLATGFGGALALAGVLGAPIGIGLAAGIIPGLVLAGIGALIGIFSRGKRRHQAAESERAFQRQIIEIRESFKRFELDFQTAIGTIEDLWAQFQTVMPQRFGKYGHRAVRGQSLIVKNVLDQIKELQNMRELRAGIISALPIPEFQLGGLVGAINARNGRILAFLHQGEAVLNRRATQIVGEQNVERLNRGQPAAAGGATFNATFNIQQLPGESSKQLARRIGHYLSRWARDRGAQTPW